MAAIVEATIRRGAISANDSRKESKMTIEDIVGIWQLPQPCVIQGRIIQSCGWR